MPRTLLDVRLDAAFDHPVTVVTAPAGAGKTLSVAEWCRHRARVPVLWERADQTWPTRALCDLLLAAAGVDVRRLPPRSSPQALRRDMLSLLEHHSAHSLVVIDDAHLLPPSSVRLIGDLLDHRPASLSLVLLCRWDLALPKLAATLRGDLCELRGDVLRMSRTESRALVEAHAPALPSDAIEAILEATEGWPALITLAAHTLATSPDPGREASRLVEPGLATADLLTTEVFPTLSAATRLLLLCVSGQDEVDAETAVRLTGDPRAGHLLAQLSRAGLLVSQVPTPNGASYRLHPILREVARRRLASGGVAVSHANAMVRKAGLSDVAAGRVADGLRRLVHARAWEDAVRTLAQHGEHTLNQLPPSVLDTVTAAASERVAASPRASLIVGLDRWAQLDVNAALPMLERVVHEADGVAPWERALARMLLARVGAEPWRGAAAEVRHLVASSPDSASRGAPLLAGWLLCELAQSEVWEGRYDDAEQHLREAVAIAEQVSPALRVGMLSHLAQLEYLRGNMRNAVTMATEVLETAPGTKAASPVVVHRARIVRALAEPLSGGYADALEVPTPILFVIDPTARALRQQVAWRHMIASGSFDEAAAWLDLRSLPLPPSPHILSRLTLDRAFVAMRLGDAPALRRLAASLEGSAAWGETETIGAFLGDLEGRLPVAAATLRRVADGRIPSLLPMTPEVAAVALAQLLGALGDRAEATAVLTSLVRRTASQRVLVPFLFRTVHGLSTSELLVDVHDAPTDWLQQVRDAAEVLEAFTFPTLATRREPESPATADLPGGTTNDLLFPLTAREHDVLAELARGSTYSDIARTLFVTENTVKTHVSSLYAKIGAARRSEALTIARAHGLL